MGRLCHCLNVTVQIQRAHLLNLMQSIAIIFKDDNVFLLLLLLMVAVGIGVKLDCIQYNAIQPDATTNSVFSTKHREKLSIKLARKCKHYKNKSSNLLVFQYQTSVVH